MEELAYQDRKTLSWLTLLSFGLLFFIGSLLLSSCTSLYDRAKARYGRDDTDTTYSMVTATVPADTIIRVFRTDTTHYVERIRQGRANVTIIREPTNTTVIAECDSATTAQRVATQINNQTWGVNPAYQRRFWIALAVLAGLLFFLLLIFILGLAAYKLSRTYQFTKKDHGTPPLNPG